MPSRILIVGASGELGGALAKFYAESGTALSLWGRDTARLNDIAEACRELGAASIATRSHDLCNIHEAIAAISLDDDAAPFDLAIIASGVGDIRAEGALVEDAALVARVGLVNFVAPAALAAELASRMARRKRGVHRPCGNPSATP